MWLMAQKKIQVVTSAGSFAAKIIKVDGANDLALLKVQGRFTPLPIAASRNVKMGGIVMTIGFPDPDLQGFSPKFAKGEIAALSGQLGWGAGRRTRDRSRHCGSKIVGQSGTGIEWVPA